MAKKKLVFYNDGSKRKNKKKPVVVVGTGGSEDIWYSLKLQQEISTLILNYGLKCSIMRFEFVANWNAISRHGIMSNEFIDIFKDRIHWEVSTFYDRLSEKVMSKHADRINWYVVSRTKKLSKEFVFKHFNDLDIDILIQRKLITIDDLDKREEELKEQKLEEAREADDIVNRFDMMDMEG